MKEQLFIPCKLLLKACVLAKDSPLHTDLYHHYTACHTVYVKGVAYPMAYTHIMLT